MDRYTIDTFWVRRLGSLSKVKSSSLVKGWSIEYSGLSTFKEAPLTQSTQEFGDGADPMKSPILLVSAPGAVGKSTLARQIAFATRSVYVDLAKADPVGGNTLSGGLARSKIYSSWEDGAITALIDGLDEATLKTTKEGFEAFLSDVAHLSADRDIPTVLFGRTGSILDAWLILTEQLGTDIAVFEIGYYPSEESVDFAEAQLTAANPDRNHPQVDRQALALLLDKLRSETASDGDRFAGYAPVLQAVAERVARESNPQTLVSEMQQGVQSSVTLHSVVSAILNREKTKLKRISFSDPNLAQRLYSPEEQLDRLVARRYNTPAPKLPEMDPSDAETYSNALETWVGEHPFLDGDSGTSSVVFDAVITAWALKGDSAVPAALQMELDKGNAANPFLYAFYFGEKLDTACLPEHHIGVIYASLRAGLARGETASLYVAEPDEDGSSALPVEVEIELTRRGKEASSLLRFNTGRGGTIYLGTDIKDVSLNMPSSRIEVGRGTEVVFTAPIDIHCKELAIVAKRVVAQNPPDSHTGVVFIQADELIGTPLAVVPLTRNEVQLRASWPGVHNYPWNSFAADKQTHRDVDPGIEEALRRFRKFVVEFRAHGHGGLARSRLKIESPRMIKGTGRAVLDAMLAAGIVRRDEARYYLNTRTLGELTGTTYESCMTYQFGHKAVAFVENAL